MHKTSQIQETSDSGERNHLVEIDALRAIAVLSVILFHIWPDVFPNGFLGVDSFFVISGFVISRGIYTSNEKFSLKQFIRKRFLRIFPPLLVVVIITAVAYSALQIAEETTLRTSTFSLIGMANFYLHGQSENYFSPSSELNPFLHTWSLGIEEQFYLVFAFIFWWSCQTQLLTQQLRRLILLCAPIFLVSLLTYFNSRGQDPQAAFYLPYSRFWELALGVLVFSIVKQKPISNYFLKNKYTMWCGILFVSTLVFLPNLQIKEGVLLTTISTAFLLVCISANKTERAISPPRLIIQLGIFSYSLYLWHWPIIVLAKPIFGRSLIAVTLMVLLMVGLSAASYLFLEVRFRRLRASNKSVFVLGLLSVGATLFVTSFVQSKAESFYLGEKYSSATTVLRTCSNEFSDTWVAGDSHGEMYQYIVGEILSSDCLYLRNNEVGDGFLFNFGYDGSYRKVQLIDPSSFLSTLQLKKPKTLFISNYLLGWFQDQARNYESADWQVSGWYLKDGTKVSRTVALNHLFDSYVDVIRMMTKWNGKVVIELPSPDFNWVSNGGLQNLDESKVCEDSWLTRGQDDNKVICELYQKPAKIAIDDFEARRSFITSAAKKKFGKFNSVVLFDPTPMMCANYCSTHKGDVRLYEDDDHYSVSGKLAMIPYLARVISSTK